MHALLLQRSEFRVTFGDAEEIALLFLGKFVPFLGERRESLALSGRDVVP